MGLVTRGVIAAVDTGGVRNPAEATEEAQTEWQHMVKWSETMYIYLGGFPVGAPPGPKFSHCGPEGFLEAWKLQ